MFTRKQLKEIAAKTGELYKRVPVSTLNHEILIQAEADRDPTTVRYSSRVKIQKYRCFQLKTIIN